MEIYGHRGAKGMAMENSLNGFRQTAAQGITRFELDVQLSKDKKLIVFHDDRLTRLVGTKHKVKHLNADRLTQSVLKGTDQRIPLLKDVVEACPNVEHWQFEIKTNQTNPHFIRPMAKLIKDLKLEDKVTITSKHRGILAAFKRVLPNIPRGYVQEWAFPNGIRTAKDLGCTYLCLSKNLAKRSYIKKAQERGLHVSVWTVNNPDDMKRLHRRGADSIISDYPLVAQGIINAL